MPPRPCPRQQESTNAGVAPRRRRNAADRRRVANRENTPERGEPSPSTTGAESRTEKIPPRRNAANRLLLRPAPSRRENTPTPERGKPPPSTTGAESRTEKIPPRRNAANRLLLRPAPSREPRKYPHAGTRQTASFYDRRRVANRENTPTPERGKPPPSTTGAESRTEKIPPRRNAANRLLLRPAPSREPRKYPHAGTRQTASFYDRRRVANREKLQAAAICTADPVAWDC